MKKSILVIILLSLLFFAGCASNRTQDRNVYTSDKAQTYLPYSDLARISHLSLNNDGYIIGVEKRGRSSLRGIPERYYIDRFEPLSEEGLDDDQKKLTHKRNKKFKYYTGHNTAMLVTHITRYFEESEGKSSKKSTKEEVQQLSASQVSEEKDKIDEINEYASTFNTFRKPSFLYNAYGKYKNDCLNYEDGYEALKYLKLDLTKHIQKELEKSESGKGQYSHIVIFSMGWNNNQQESIYRYNTILDNVKEIADITGEYFKPLVIGFTWPSVWYGIENNWLKKNTAFLFSYFAKQDDADEIGCTIANWVIHKVILEAIDEVKKSNENLSPKVIAIGHSMGARLLSRSIFSKEYIKEKSSESYIDLFIGLQGAFSAKRFVKGRGWEGSPYAEFQSYPTWFSLTSSQYDLANPAARFFTGARHVGGKYGLKFAEKDEKNNEENKNIFRVIKWTNNYKKDLDTLSLIPKDNRKVIMIDASKIVDGHNSDSNEDKPLDAHNDILDKDMAQLIWILIKTFAPYKCQMI